uniref:DUF775 domain-containing protein n=2 Tax=Strongyloides stercoralis TaxID=6248 RepID=A0AAF5CZV4_STRER
RKEGLLSITKKHRYNFPNMTSNVFGALVVGRSVNANFEIISPTNFLCTIQDNTNITHIVVFMTGVEAFPEGYGGSIYMRWASIGNADPAWHYLGAITNSKPSAMFKVGNLYDKEPTHSNIFSQQNIFTMAHNCCQIGIQVEPESEINQRIASEGVKPSMEGEMTEFCRKMLSNFFNYCQSFVTTLPSNNGFGHGSEVIPAKCLEQWYNKFESRMKANPKFWKDLS